MAVDTNYIYQTIIADMSEGLMVIGFDGVITHLNDAAEIILDKKKDKLIGKKFAISFIRFKENDEFNQAIIDAIYDRTKTHKNIVSYFNGKDFKQVSITTSFLHNNGEKAGIVVVLNDISELVELRDAVKVMERIKRLNTQLEMRNKLISATFGRYLSDEIVKELLEKPGGLQLGGKKRTITIMMSDLRNFTSISELLDPTELIDMLNHYLTVMGKIISDYNGTIIEFLGDGLFVIFGAPIEAKNHALNAVLTAIKMQAAMPDINKWNQERGYPVLSMGIGINTGEVVVGNIGSEKTTKYGVMGKNVNLCGRVESYSVGGQVLISPYTKAAIDVPLKISKEFEVRPKGLKDSIIISDVTGVLGDYNVHCPSTDIALMPLKRYYDIEFYELVGKNISEKPGKGRIAAISKTHAILITDTEFMPFTNIDVCCDSVSNIFCKVVDETECGYIITFTSDASPLLEAIKNSN